MSDDRTIVRRALDQRPGAFEQLVARHERLVWHIVLKMVANREDAGDLVQEVFLRVHRKLGQFRFDASLSTWIGRIAYSVALRFLERKHPDVAPFDDEAHASGTAQPDRVAEANDAKRRVALALAALPPVPRTIVSLYHLQDLGVDEIAAMTGLPPGTVKSHLYRARRRMKQILEDNGGWP